MTSAYMRNLMGLGVSDEDLSNIPHPRLELALHMGLRFTQAGAILGSMVAAPLVTALGGPRTLGDLLDRALRYGVAGARIGAVAGPLASVALTRKESDVAIYNRCYWLRFNADQVRQDRYFLIGATLGGVSNGPQGALVGILGGVALANAVGVLRRRCGNDDATAKKAPRYEELNAEVQAAQTAMHDF